MPSLEFIKSEILPKAVAAGGFGENAEFVGVVEDPTKGEDQFASSVQFLEVDLRVDGVSKRVPIFCKFQCEVEELRELLQTHLQFYNEVLVYKEIVPLLPKSAAKLMPEFIYGISTLKGSPEDDVIIVENLIPCGYRQSTERVWLDYEHCLVTFRRLGEFHGATLQLKTKHPLKFANKINQLVETRWTDKNKDDFNYFFKENAKRGILPLMKNREHVEVLNMFLEKLDNIYGLIKDILEVNEFSLLCHGDFCRNNMTFKYEHDRPVDVKFFDLATARYASPIIDISFFLFLNTTPELRRTHLKENFLRVYLEAVQAAAGMAAPSMTELWEEFQHKAVYGYLLAAFFLPIMLNDMPDEEKRPDMTLEERVQRNLIRGGQKVTDMLSQSVEDLIAWGCLK